MSTHKAEPDTSSDAEAADQDIISLSKTVGESDVYLFAGITGDLAPVHVDAEFMRTNSPFGERIAHGVLVLGFTSAASTILAGRLCAAHGWRSMVSLGYDGVRFVAPVRIGDTVTVRYWLKERDASRQRTTSQFEVVNQRGEKVLVGRHIMKWFE